MMRKLDRDRLYGTHTPPWLGNNEEFDRPALYNQDDRDFDKHGLEIVPGKPTKTVKAAPAPVEEPDEEEDDEVEEVAVEAPPVVAAETPLSPTQLLEQAGTLPFKKFHDQAKRILGPKCPNGKQAIVLALQEALAGYAKRQEAKGLTWGHSAKPRAPKGAPTEQPAAVPQQAPAPAPAAVPNGTNSTDVDLAMWGRGKKEYRFAEVTKAIRQKHHRQIGGEHARKDAVDCLIEERVITAAEARKDV